MSEIVPYNQLPEFPYDRVAAYAAMASGNRIAQAQAAGRVARQIYEVAKPHVAKYYQDRKNKRYKYVSAKRSGRNADQSATRKLMKYARSGPLKLQELIAEQMTFPSVNNLTNDRTRTSNRAFLSGFKVCMTFFNDATFPIQVNYAILRFKNKEYTTSNVATPEINGDFFRDVISTVDNEADFPTGTVAYDSRLKCFPINNQRFDILTHRKEIMGGKLSTISVNDAKHVIKYEKWFRVNKKIQFEQAGDTNCNYPFVAVAWATPLDGNDFSSAATPWRWETWITPYFRSM